MTIVDLRGEADPEAAAIAWMRAEWGEHRSTCSAIGSSCARCCASRTNATWSTPGSTTSPSTATGAMTFANRAAERYTAAVEHRAPPRHSPSTRSPPRSSRTRLATVRPPASSPTAPTGPNGLPICRTRSVSQGVLPPVGPHPVRWSEPLPDHISGAVDRLLAASPGTTFATVVVSAFAAFLSRVTGERDVVLSLPVSARTTAKLRRSGGMVSNVVPIRVTVDPDDTAGDLMRRVQLELTGALRHQRYRAEDMRRDSGYGGAARGFFGPAVNIMMFHGRVRLGAATGQLHVLSTGPAEDLSLNIYPSGPDDPAAIDFEANPQPLHARRTPITPSPVRRVPRRVRLRPRSPRRSRCAARRRT